MGHPDRQRPQDTHLPYPGRLAHRIRACGVPTYMLLVTC